MLHMEQKLYRYEIMRDLLKGEKYLRKVAKDLKTNHMTIKRILDKMVKENILDVKLEGRNKVFFIKKTLEAFNEVIMAEAYMQNVLVNRHPELKQDIGRLKKMKANLIIIFGSYAGGNETKESDIDIYIKTKDRKIKEEVEKMNSKFAVKIGKYDKKSLLVKEIEKNHIIIKGIEEFYEKNRFFD